MIEELRRHGYKLSAGTLYPILHDLSRRACSDRQNRCRGAERKVYRATPVGRKALSAVKAKVRELFEDEGVDHERRAIRIQHGRSAGVLGFSLRARRAGRSSFVFSWPRCVLPEGVQKLAFATSLGRTVLRT